MSLGQDRFRQRYAELFVTVRASRVARLSKAETQELWLLCLLFAERAQEGRMQTGLSWAENCLVSWIADDRADVAISTRMTHSRLAASTNDALREARGLRDS